MPAPQPPAQQPSSERRHQRDAGAAMLLGAVVLAVLMVGYVYLHR